MLRRQFAALASTLFVAGTLGSTVAQDKASEFAETVIVACDHSAGTPLVTRVSGVETAGRVDEVSAALQVGTSCAEVFNSLAEGGFELVLRTPGISGDFDNDGDVDGRDFLVWQRGGSPAAARPSRRVTTVLISCEYVVADTLMTRVAGSEIAGRIDASLAAALAARPSCAVAYAALAGAGFGLVSAAPGPAAGGGLADWQTNYGTGG